MAAKSRRLTARLGELRLQIEEDTAGGGWYLNVYNNGSCSERHLKRTLELAKKHAHALYAIPDENWQDED